jgi:hypothetical protein
MTNLERLQMEISDISYTTEQLTVFLQENNLETNEQYNPSSNTNKKNILKTALSILEAIANNPKLMKSYKTEDISVTEFSENLQSRIDQLERKIRMLPDDYDVYNDAATFTYIFTE